MSIRVKAERLLEHGRVHLMRSKTTHSGNELRWFTVEGDHDLYQVWWSDIGMRCSCPARVRCSHELAVVMWADKYHIHPLTGGNVVDEKGE